MKSVLLAILLSLLPCFAHASSDGDLRRAKDYFEYGEYEKARAIAESLLEANVLALDDQLIDANRIAGLAWFYGDHPERLARAERHFLQLLSIEPEYRLDPFFTPPAAVQFFDEVKLAHESRLAPIREQRRLAKEARRAEEAARKRFLEEQQRQATAGADPTPLLVERHNLALVFLPLGAGQFQNGDNSSGYVLASVQVLAGLTSVFSYVAIEQLRTDGGFTRSDIRLARNLDTVKWASAVLFYAAYAYSVGDAWIKYEPEVVRPPSGGQPIRSEVFQLSPSVDVGKDGGSLGLSFNF